MSDFEHGFRVGPDPAPKVWNPINAAHVADVLEAVLRGEGHHATTAAGVQRVALLREVLTIALDSSELARLYCVATAKLGIRLFDFERYCPWCDQEYEEERFGDHMEAQHRSMVLA